MPDEAPHCVEVVGKEAVGNEVMRVDLPYDMRKRSRLRATSRCGREIGIQLPRGTELLHGQRLLGEGGEQVEIVASEETVSTVSAKSQLLLLKAAYHLGNRHVPLQVTENWLRYQHDHVLDDMVVGLGLNVSVEQAPFQPESGAYHRHSDSASDSHGHGSHPQAHIHGQ